MRAKIFFMAAITSLLALVASCEGPSDKQEKDKKDKAKMEKEKKDKHSKDYKKVAILVGEGFHDGEAYMPMGYLANRGVKSVVIGPEKGEVKSYNSDFTIRIHKAVRDVKPEYFDALILPGGKAPASLREDESVIAFVQEFYKTDKPIAAICHGPQVLITAGLMQDRMATAFSDVKEELEDAGADYLDEPLVIDGNFITSRVPKDLHHFSHAIWEAIK